MSEAKPCIPHNDARNYDYQQAPYRSDWYRVTCTQCGGFIGYRPKDINEYYKRRGRYFKELDQN